MGKPQNYSSDFLLSLSVLSQIYFLVGMAASEVVIVTNVIVNEKSLDNAQFP